VHADASLLPPERNETSPITDAAKEVRLARFLRTAVRVGAPGFAVTRQMTVLQRLYTFL